MNREIHAREPPGIETGTWKIQYNQEEDHDKNPLNKDILSVPSFPGVLSATSNEFIGSSRLENPGNTRDQIPREDFKDSVDLHMDADATENPIRRNTGTHFNSNARGVQVGLAQKSYSSRT